MVNVEKWAKLKEISFRQTLTIKEVLDFVLDIAISMYETKHGKIIPHPEMYKGDINNLFQ